MSQRIDFVRSSLPSSEQLILETVEETTHGVVLRVRAKQEGKRRVERIGQILSMFPTTVSPRFGSFGEVVPGGPSAFWSAAKFTWAVEYIGAHGFTTAIDSRSLRSLSRLNSIW